jgi:uncharacterized protein YndB with AHSA1/START domain
MSGNKNATRNSRFIKATPEALYGAFTDPAALAVWQAPGDLIAKVHSFDCRVGGGYQMSLFYPSSEKASRGKTAEGKIDLLHGSWNSRRPEELLKR